MSDKGNSKEEKKEPTKYRCNEDRHIDNVTRHRITVEDRKIDRDKERKRDRRTDGQQTDTQTGRLTGKTWINWDVQFVVQTGSE